MISTRLHPWTPKLLWLVLPSLVGSVIWWYIVDQVLQGRFGFTAAALPLLLTFIIFGIFALGLWLGALGVTSFLAGWRSVRATLAFVTSLPILVFFPLALMTAGVLIGVWLALWWGMERVADDGHSRLQVRPRLSVLSGMPLTVLLVMLGVSFLYYQQLHTTAQSATQLESKLTNQSVSLAERFMPLLYKEYQPGQTLDELIGSQFPTAEEIVSGINFSQNNISDQVKQQLIAQGIDPSSISVANDTNQQALTAALDTQLNNQKQESIDVNLLLGHRIKN